jgi:hypothetical protein
MKMFKIVGILLATSLMLAGCGGGATLSGGGGGGGGGATVSSVIISSSKPGVAQDGSTSSTISATALNSSNVAVTGVVVQFQVTAGGVLAVTQGTTDANGVAKASLTAAPGTATTAVIVKAVAGSVAASATVNITAVQQTLTLSTNAPQVTSDGSKSATITALLRDANNNVLPGVQVQFSPDTGAATPIETAAGGAVSPKVPAGTTDSNGIAQATVNAGGNFTNRTITVTASAGSAPNSTIKILVLGTALSITGQQNIVLGTQTPFTATLTDSSGQGIAATPVSFSSANGNTLSASSVNTDSAGHATVKLTAVTAGSDTITASALGLTSPTTTNISGQNFSITAPAKDALIQLGTFAPVSITWTSNNLPVVGAPVAFSTTRGAFYLDAAKTPLPSPLNTDANGQVSVVVESDLAGPAIIAASGASVSAQVPVTFVSNTASQVAVQASPATVAIGGQSTISAIVRDVKNNLVQNASVDFVLVNDNTGASLLSPTATTNSQGTAQVIFQASSTPTSGDGITVQATVHGTAVSGTTKLVVGGQTVFLSLGTGNTIGTPSSAQYSQVWAVQAVDSHGGAVPNQPITAQVLPLYYYKGFRIWGGTYWVTVNSIPNCPGNQPCTDATVYLPSTYSYVPNGTQCANEDVNWTGIYVASQDLNQNGVIDPGNIASVDPSTGGVTDPNGSLLVTVVWPRDHAYYVGVRLLVKATVAGTESTASADFVLPGLATDFNQETTAPPGPFSPYGVYNSLTGDCSNKK